jgi:hypothetical protein
MDCGMSSHQVLRTTAMVDMAKKRGSVELLAV